MAGYSKTPLIKKLGIKENMRVLFMNAPHGFAKTLGVLPKGVVRAHGLEENLPYIHYFPEWKRELRAIIPILKKSLARDGMLWISWHKHDHEDGCADSDLNENVIRKIGLDAGLVDIKVCAVDDHLSGLKFVWRVKDRSGKERK